MAGATNEGSTTKTEIGLVLQGGGALGAYEWGAIEALFDLMDETEKAGTKIELCVVTGVSIGAINAACIVGAENRSDARARLGGLWNDFMIKAPAFVPALITSQAALFEVPHFYRFWPGWNFTYLYDTHELLTTLSKHVDFAALNNNKIAFVVTAADVTGGELTSFANRKVGVIEPRKIEPRHVLASGSLAPQFPATQIGEGTDTHYYWDGGLIDNTPLGAAIDVLDPHPDIRKLLVVMNLFPLQSRAPTSYAEVNERIDQLRFGNRLRQDASVARQFNKLLRAIKSIPDPSPGLQDILKDYKIVDPVEVSLGEEDSYKDPYGFRDFSQPGLERRRARGYEAARAALKDYFPATLAA